VDFLHVVLLFLVVVMFSSVVNISQVIGWEGWVFCTSQEKIVSEMTYNVYRAGRYPYSAQHLLRGAGCHLIAMITCRLWRHLAAPTCAMDKHAAN